MDDFQEKINSVLNDPGMMAQIMSMAQAFSAPQEQSPQQQNPLLEGMDPGMLQKIASFAGKTGIDRDQQALLRALQPYISSQRIAKLEKAMRSAKIAGAITGLLGSGIF